MIIRRFVGLLLLFASVSAVYGLDGAQASVPTASDFFAKAPIEIVSQIPANFRLDMIDYYRSGSKVKVNNRLGAKVGLRSIEDYKVVYEDEDSIVTSISVLPTAKDDTILMLIRTIPTPMPDSEIAFYDSKWNPLQKTVLSSLELSDWASDKAITREKRTNYELPFMLTLAEYDPMDKTLVLNNGMDEFYTGADRPAIVEALYKTLTYQWNGTKFVLQSKR